MAVINQDLLTLLDWAKRLDPKGNTANIVEMLSQVNGILGDMLFKEGNLPTGHRTTVRTGLPAVIWRILNKGVAKSKSTSAQIDETCGMLEARSEVDQDLAELNGNTAAFRLSEAQAFVEAMSQEMASTLFYGNSDLAPEEFTGLAPRFSSLAAANGENIVNGGGSGGDCTSIWLVTWGENSVHGIFPKGSTAGLKHENLGLGDAFDSDQNRFRAYMDRWAWKCGIALKDWRYVSRGANIDVGNLTSNTTPPDIINIMIKMTHRIHNLQGGKPVFYCNRSIIQYLDLQRRADVISGGGLTYDNVDGKIEYKFRGIPIRVCDAILDTEATVA